MDLWKRVKLDRDNIKSKFLHMGRQQWAVLLLVGLLLAVMALPVSHKEQSAADTWTSLPSNASGQDEVSNSELEHKLEVLLSQVEGVGKVQVILMTGEADTQNFYDSGEKKVTGVLIAAQGGDNYVTVENIQQAVMALFQIEAHKIKVMKMK